MLFGMNRILCKLFYELKCIKDMRSKNKLTDLSIKQAVKKAKDSTKTIKISDGGGMYLQIQPNGSYIGG